MGELVPRGKARCVPLGHPAGMDAFTRIGQGGAVPDAHPDLPLMQLSRLRGEHFFASSRHNSALFHEDPSLAVEFGVVARVCLPDWIRGNAMARPVAATRAISMRKIAESLNASAETTRRHVFALRDLGAVTIAESGVAVAATADNEARAWSYYLGMHDAFVRLIADMHATCDLTIAVSDTVTFTRQEVVGQALDMLLLQIDTYRPADVHSVALYLWGALCGVAVRGITFDPVLSRRYAHTLPPDELRAGISLRKLAAALSIPYATAWRAAKLLDARGLATRLSAGRWTVLTHSLAGGTVESVREPQGMSMVRRMRELAAMGFDPARAGDYYAVGKPLRADFGPEPIA